MRPHPCLSCPRNGQADEVSSDFGSCQQPTGCLTGVWEGYMSSSASPDTGQQGDAWSSPQVRPLRHEVHVCGEADVHDSWCLPS